MTKNSEIKHVNITITNLNKSFEAERLTTLYELLKNENIDDFEKYLAARYSDNLVSLNHPLDHDCSNVTLYTYEDSQGYRAYCRSLAYVLCKAVKDLFPEKTLTFNHSLSKGLYGKIKGETNISRDSIHAIKKRMDEIITKDIPFDVETTNVLDILDRAKNNGWKDKERLYKYADHHSINWNRMENLEDYLFGPLVPATGALKHFELMYYPPGFVLIFPRIVDIDKLNEFSSQKKIFRIFREYEQWGDIMDVPDIGSLNEVISRGEKDIVNLIAVAESLQEKKISTIADKITEDPNIRVVTIAGPSSSGKTTFSKRLQIQLIVNGMKSKTISLDDYFKNREETPIDENGEYDFEDLDALNLEKFNNDILDLLDGKEIRRPKYDFKTGKSLVTDKTLKIDRNTIIIVEGIHGLNEDLTRDIPDPITYKIYVSALTQLNIDYHNRIHTTDNRLIRRMVRDHKYRNHTALQTFQRWPSVRRGEEKNIFPFQENADVAFNSALIYELAILKTRAEPLLRSIPKETEEYLEARRLLELLSFFQSIDISLVPSKSIIREFVGGSMFIY